MVRILYVRMRRRLRPSSTPMEPNTLAAQLPFKAWLRRAASGNVIRSMGAAYATALRPLGERCCTEQAEFLQQHS
jgi:hypothetical protein